MKKLNFTKEKLEDYYENRFRNDLEHFFELRKEGDAEYADRVKAESIVTMESFMRPSTIFHGVPQRKTEDEFYFAALVEFMVIAEGAIAFNAKRKGMNEQEVALMVNAFGFPLWKGEWPEGEDLFKQFFPPRGGLQQEEEIVGLQKALLIVEPYMTEKLVRFFDSWKDGAYRLTFCYMYTCSLSEHIHKRIRKDIAPLLDKYCKPKGLTGFDLSIQQMDDYFQNRFIAQLKEYFNCEKKENYLKTFLLWRSDNDWWDYAKQEVPVYDRFLFAVTIIYMTIAQQSILETVPKSSDDFHNVSGWPIICAGASAEYLPSLLVLEDAGLAPKKYETSLLLEVCKQYFPYLREQMNTALNKMKSMRGKRSIKNYMKEEEKNVQDLLAKWITHPKKSFQGMFMAEGVRIQLEIK